jgi:FdhD protein
MRPSSVGWSVQRSSGAREDDRVVVEEPLEIRLNGRSLVVTMRTPGNDDELALGFLANEGLVAPAAYPTATIQNPLDPQQGNIVNVRVPPERILRAPDARSFHASSSCGVCGQASLEDMARTFAPVAGTLRVASSVLTTLPAAMRAAQPLFDETGGLHAAAAFDARGKLLALREDVGRHNAVDKLTGWALREGPTAHRPVPTALAESILLLSGRAGYEVVQKAVASRIPIVAAVGAPTSLAARLAEQAGVTLVGFLRGSSFNVYAHAERILP